MHQHRLKLKEVLIKLLTWIHIKQIGQGPSVQPDNTVLCNSLRLNIMELRYYSKIQVIKRFGLDKPSLLPPPQLQQSWTTADEIFGST